MKYFDVENLKRGDKIRGYRGALWWHEALFIGEDVDGVKWLVERRLYGVRRTRLDTFLKYYLYTSCEHITYLGKFDRSEVVARALACIGNRYYHPLKANCEHFVSWCQTDLAHSEQALRFCGRPIVATARVVDILFVITAAGGLLA